MTKKMKGGSRAVRSEENNINTPDEQGRGGPPPAHARTKGKARKPDESQLPPRRSPGRPKKAIPDSIETNRRAIIGPGTRKRLSASSSENARNDYAAARTGNLSRRALIPLAQSNANGKARSRYLTIQESIPSRRVRDGKTDDSYDNAYSGRLTAVRMPPYSLGQQFLHEKAMQRQLRPWAKTMGIVEQSEYVFLNQVKNSVRYISERFIRLLEKDIPREAWFTPAPPPSPSSVVKRRE